jgi:hypothetical protein
MSLADYARRILAGPTRKPAPPAPTKLEAPKVGYLGGVEPSRGGAIRRHAGTAQQIRRAAHEAAGDLAPAEGWTFSVPGTPTLRVLPSGARGTIYLLDIETTPFEHLRASLQPLGRFNAKLARARIALYLRKAAERAPRVDGHVVITSRRIY